MKEYIKICALRVENLLIAELFIENKYKLNMTLPFSRGNWVIFSPSGTGKSTFCWNLIKT